MSFFNPSSGFKDKTIGGIFADAARAVIPQSIRDIAGATARNTGSTALSVLAAIDKPLSERAGLEIPSMRGPLDEIGNFLLREGTRPTNIGFAAGGPVFGGLKAAKFVAGGGRARSLGRGLLEPLVAGRGSSATGRFAQRLGAEAGVSAGARGGSELGAKTGLPGGALVGGLAGGLGAAGGLAAGLRGFKSQTLPVAAKPIGGAADKIDFDQRQTAGEQQSLDVLPPEPPPPIRVNNLNDPAVLLSNGTLRRAGTYKADMNLIRLTEANMLEPSTRSVLPTEARDLMDELAENLRLDTINQRLSTDDFDVLNINIFGDNDAAVLGVRQLYEAGERYREILRESGSLNPDDTITLFRGEWRRQTTGNYPGSVLQRPPRAIPKLGRTASDEGPQSLLEWSPDPSEASEYGADFIPGLLSGDATTRFIYSMDVPIDDIIIVPGMADLESLTIVVINRNDINPDVYDFITGLAYEPYQVSPFGFSTREELMRANEFALEAMERELDVQLGRVEPTQAERFAISAAIREKLHFQGKKPLSEEEIEKSAKGVVGDISDDIHFAVSDTQGKILLESAIGNADNHYQIVRDLLHTAGVDSSTLPEKLPEEFFAADRVRATLEDIVFEAEMPTELLDRVMKAAEDFAEFGMLHWEEQLQVADFTPSGDIANNALARIKDPDELHETLKAARREASKQGELATEDAPALMQEIEALRANISDMKADLEQLKANQVDIDAIDDPSVQLAMGQSTGGKIQRLETDITSEQTRLNQANGTYADIQRESEHKSKILKVLDDKLKALEPEKDFRDDLPKFRSDDPDVDPIEASLRAAEFLDKQIEKMELELKNTDPLDAGSVRKKELVDKLKHARKQRGIIRGRIARLGHRPIKGGAIEEEMSPELLEMLQREGIEYIPPELRAEADIKLDETLLISDRPMLRIRNPKGEMIYGTPVDDLLETGRNFDPMSKEDLDILIREEEAQFDLPGDLETVRGAAFEDDPYAGAASPLRTAEEQSILDRQAESVFGEPSTTRPIEPAEDIYAGAAREAIVSTDAELNRLKKEIDVLFDEDVVVTDELIENVEAYADRYAELSGSPLKKEATRQNAPNVLKRLAKSNTERFLGKRDTTLPPQLQKIADDLAKDIKDPEGILAVNQILRNMWATADMSFAGVQGLLFMARNPLQAPVMLWRTFQALLNPATANNFFRQFDEAARLDSMPNTRQWQELGGVHLAAFERPADFAAPKGVQSLPGIGGIFRASDNAFSMGGDYARLTGANNELRRFGKTLKTATPDELKSIGAAMNRATGFADKPFLGGTGLGPVAQFAFFAPRFMQSQIEMIVKSFTDGTLEGQIARKQIASLIGWGVSMTVIANGVRPDTREAFDPTSRRFMFNPGFIPGTHPGSQANFMRILDVGGDDVSLFGPWDSAIKMGMAIMRGDKDYVLRTKLSPLASIMVNLWTGKTFLGDKFDISNKTLIAQETLLPFAWRDVSPARPIPAALSFFGVKSSPLSPSELLEDKMDVAGFDPEDPLERLDYLAQHPEDRPKAFSDERRAANEIQDDIRVRTQALEMKVIGSQTTLKDYRETRRNLNRERRNKLEVIFGDLEDTEPRNEQQRWIKEYFTIFKESSDPTTGDINGETLDRKLAIWRAGNPPEAWDYVGQYSLTGKGEVETKYLTDMNALATMGFFDLPRYRGMRSGLTDPQINEFRDMVSAARSVDPVLRGASFSAAAVLVLEEQGLSREQITDVINSGKNAFENPEYTRFRQLHPELLLWFQDGATWQLLQSAGAPQQQRSSVPTMGIGF